MQAKTRHHRKGFPERAKGSQKPSRDLVHEKMFFVTQVTVAMFGYTSYGNYVLLTRRDRKEQP
jgi:hypothetical protein